MASTAVTRLYISVLDQVGRLTKTAINLALAQYDPSTGQGAAFKAIVLALINGGSKVVKLSATRENAIGTSATDGGRNSREDKVTLDLADENGQVHTFRIPTPSTSLSTVLGGETVNIANTNVTAWASQMVAHACTADGVAYVGSCTGGRYIRHKKEKKGGF